jgi:hypothetical protein
MNLDVRSTRGFVLGACNNNRANHDANRWRALA